MEVVPVTVGHASRAWDDQSLQLTAASLQVGDAGREGFTPAVSAAAARFALEWRRHLEGAATEAEARADGLRTAIADYLSTDRAVAAETVLLPAYLLEAR